MADEIDTLDSKAELERLEGIRRVRAEAAKIPAGEPGECSNCGEWSPRLVGGLCALCRDGR